MPDTYENQTTINDFIFMNDIFSFKFQCPFL